MPLKSRLSDLARSLSREKSKGRAEARAAERAKRKADKKAQDAAHVADVIAAFTAGSNQSKYEVVGARAGLIDHRSEDVADRNLARQNFFPPRVSSAAYVDPQQAMTTVIEEEEVEVAQQEDGVRAKWRPLIPSEDKFSSRVAEWNNVQYGSPRSLDPAVVPLPLVFKKHIGSPKACVFGDE